MALTRNFKQTVVERIHRDPAFAQTLLGTTTTCRDRRWAASVILAQFRVPALPPRQLHSARVELGVTLAQFWR